MSGKDEDTKPTRVLDFSAIRKRKLKQENELNDIVNELEFTVHEDISPATLSHSAPVAPTPLKSKTELPKNENTTVVLFDFQSDFFKKNLNQFPKGHNYHVVTTLDELNKHLKSKEFQIIVFNYDVNPKAVNQLCAQIKQKRPQSKALIMARAISPEKAKVHAKSSSGASGYYQFPLETSKIEEEFQKIITVEQVKAA